MAGNVTAMSKASISRVGPERGGFQYMGESSLRVPPLGLGERKSTMNTAFFGGPLKKEHPYSIIYVCVYVCMCICM